MRTIKDNLSLLHEEFTYFEFLEYVEKCEPSRTARIYSRNSSQKIYDYDDNSKGTRTFADAIKLAREGWDTGIEQLQLTDGELTNVGIIASPNVTGSYVNMESYLTGEPLDMFELQDEREYNLPELTIYAHMDYAGGVNLKKAMRFCQSMIHVVNEMQSTHNVKLVVRNNDHQRETETRCDVIVKDINERFVLNNVAFAFHPAFLRRLWFKYIESKECIAYGYGRAISHPKFVENIKKDEKGNKVLILPSLDGLNTDGSFDMSHKDVVKLNF